MKRAFSIVLLLILILCLANCRSKPGSDTIIGSSCETYEDTELGNLTISLPPVDGGKKVLYPTGYIVPITPEPGQNIISPGITLIPGSSMPFEYKRIRTNSYDSNIESPKVIMIHSKKELDNYYESASKGFQMYAFKKAMDAYDDNWFDSNLLILVVLEENSGSIGHEVTSVSPNNNVLEINISRTIPETGTCDMAQYHILINISLSDYNSETPKVIFNNKRQ